MYKLAHGLYVLSALTPLWIVYLCRFGYLVWAFAVLLFSWGISHWCLYDLRRKHVNEQAEQCYCSTTEVIDPQYIPVYIGYFVIAVSLGQDSWLGLVAVHLMLFVLVFNGQFAYFNPYVMFGFSEPSKFQRWYFYAITIEGQPQFKVFLISTQVIKNIAHKKNLIRLDAFTYLDKDAS